MARRLEPQRGLGLALKQIREERGLSQEQVAHDADVHPTWVSHLESGRNNPAWGTVRRLCAALGVSLGELVARVEQLEDD